MLILGFFHGVARALQVLVAHEKTRGYTVHCAQTDVIFSTMYIVAPNLRVPARPQSRLSTIFDKFLLLYARRGFFDIVKF